MGTANCTCHCETANASSAPVGTEWQQADPSGAFVGDDFGPGGGRSTRRSGLEKDNAERASKVSRVSERSRPSEMRLAVSGKFDLDSPGPVVRLRSESSVTGPRVRCVSSNGTVQSMEDVNMSLLESLKQVDPVAPFSVVSFEALKAYGRLPRSDSGLAVLHRKMPSDVHVVFLSHRWLRPWHTCEECEANGHAWTGEPHPDDKECSKFHLLIYGIEHVAKLKDWSLSKIAVWMDYACINQDDMELRVAGVRSLIGYMFRCDLVMIPINTKPDYHTVHRMPFEYGDRAWTRLEALGCYVKGLLDDQKPELFFSAPVNQVDELDYVLLPNTMPSSGVLAVETDRPLIQQHENTLLEHVHESALSGSEAARGPALVAAAGLGKIEEVKSLLAMLEGNYLPNAGVNTQDHSGITGLWSAARQGQLELVQYLLEQRADPDLPANSGLSPLHTAAQQGQTEVAAMLLQYKANIDARDAQGNTPLLWAIQSWNDKTTELLLENDPQNLDLALRIALSLGQHKDAGPDDIDWAEKVVAAIKAAKGRQMESREPVVEAKKSEKARVDKTVEMACNRAVRKRLSTRSSLELYAGNDSSNGAMSQKGSSSPR